MPLTVKMNDPFLGF